MITIRAAGLVAHLHDRGGSGPAALLLPGNSMRHTSLDPLVEATPARRWVVAWPGIGSAPDARDPSAYGLRGLRALVAAAVDAIGEAPLLIGHSLGGHLALQHLAADGRCRGVLAFGCVPLSLPVESWSMMAYADRMAPALRGEVDADDLDAFVRRHSGDARRQATVATDYRDTDPAFRTGLAASLAAGEGLDEEDAIATAKVPVWIAGGQDDDIVPSRLVAMRADGHLLSGGHWCFAEHPAATSALIARWIACVDAPRTSDPAALPDPTNNH